MMIESITIFRLPPMPSDVSFPPRVQKKSRGGRSRSATTSTASAAAAAAASSRSRSTAPAPATAAAPCPDSKFTKYSVAALDAALGNDIDRLLSFAANTELSGENILFLKSVELWKARWRHRGGEQKRKRWQEAHDIWRHLVDRDTAEFPLNIEDAVYRNLERVFGAASAAAGKSCIVPFADDVALGRHSRGRTAAGISGFPAASAELVATAAPPRASLSEHEQTSLPLVPTRKEDVEVALEVFDKAEASVRQMVLENTWIRYVDSLSESYADVLMSSSSPRAGYSWHWKSVFRKKS